MTESLLILSVFLLANLLVAVVRLTGGPTPADRMIAVLLFGSTGVALLLLLAYARDTPALVDAALALALLGSVIGVAFVQQGWKREGDERNERS